MDLSKPIAKGNTADIYLYEGQVVKLFHNRLPVGTAEYEAQKQTAAFACGLPVPRLLGVACIDGRQALLMEYVTGPTIGDMILASPKKITQHLSVTLNLQMVVHAKIVSELEPMKEKLRRQIITAVPLDAACKEKLLACLAVLPVANNLCHGDFHPFNLIQAKKDEVYIIDWVDATAGHPCADACRSYLLYADDAALAERYLDMYCAKSGYPREAVLAWLPVIAGARLSERLDHHKTQHMMRLVQQYL